MMALWIAFKQQNCASDNKIGPIEEEPNVCYVKSCVIKAGTVITMIYFNSLSTIQYLS